MTSVEAAIERLRKGNRLAIIAPLAEGRFSVWVGYDGGPNGGDIGAFWFRGRTTSGAEYANLGNAHKAAEKFLNH